MIHRAWCVLFGAALVTAMWTAAVRAQPPRSYPCVVNDWDCVNGKLISQQDQINQLRGELLYNQEALRQARDEVAGLRQQGTVVPLTRDQIWALSLDAAYFQLRRYGVVK